MERTQISLTAEQARALRTRANAEGTTVSALIRAAVDASIAAPRRDRQVELARLAVGVGASGRNRVADDHDDELDAAYGTW